MFGCCYGLYGSKILKLFHLVTFWFDKWSAPRNYLRFSQIKKMKQCLYSLLNDIFPFKVSKPWAMIWVLLEMQIYYEIKLVDVNFACYRSWLHLPVFIILCKTKEITTYVHWTMTRIELTTFMLETKFLTTEPLRQWYIKWKLDDTFDSLSFLLGCQLFFYFSLFASCHSEVWRVSLQVFESKIDQKCCCITLLLKKRTSTQQRRFMNINYPTFSWPDVISTKHVVNCTCNSHVLAIATGLT